MDVSGYFAGVEFPEGTSAMYRPEFKKLFVRQTPGNFLLIEDVLGDRHSRKRELMGKQVEIQTKFVEVSQNTLNELGFSWNFGSKNGGDANLFENLTLPAGQDIMASGLRTAAGALGTDFNPIEKMWSKIKILLRGLAARTQDELSAAITQAVNAVTPEDAQGWFLSCGITVSQS